MDYLTRQLLLELTKLREAFGKYDTAISAINKRGQQQNEIENKRCKEVFAAYEKSERNKTISEARQYTIQKRIAYATWIAAVAAIIAAAGAWYYASIANGQSRVPSDDPRADTLRIKELLDVNAR